MANSLHVKMYSWDIGQVMKQTDVIKKFADETKTGQRVTTDQEDRIRLQDALDALEMIINAIHAQSAR
jgi:hypothetical protein